MLPVGFTNESIEELAVQGWFYSIDKMTDAFYADAVYNVKALESLGMTFMGQYARFNEDTKADGTLSGIDGNVYGLAVNAQWGMVTLGVAYNEAKSDDGKWINNGLGGGPYYTSMEEWTIGWMEDEKAYQLQAIIDMKDAGVEGLSFTTLYGEFKSAPVNVKMIEWDIIATYEYDDALSADVSYASLNDKNDNQNSGSDAGYDRFLARISYRF
ncbi:MAG: OprD family outer membrane porin [Sulfuricurvum sp.]|nr:OprD family outer membrane porin [Sulfuricurvum sp.]